MYTCNYKFISRRFRLKTFACILLALLQCSSCTRAIAPHKLYWITAETDNPSDNRWANYLCDHLNRRSNKEDVAVSIKPQTDDFFQVTVHVNSNHEYDYSVVRKDNILNLTARDDSKMLWLIYQFISGTEDKRLNLSDLPPAMIDLNGTKGNFVFEYRGIYTPSNSNKELMAITSSHNVDYDWGLWGHNLGHVFPDGIPEEARAVVNGQRQIKQFCFSSEILYKAIETYIIDNFGEGKNNNTPVRFTIMPNDNDAICTCKQCIDKGNTSKSATPAVSSLIHRIAKRFPHHLFFTSAYLSTYTPPTKKMPSNTGVIISAMEIPMQAKIPMKSVKTTKFSELVNQWHNVTDRIYIWDYMRNFDDYLTPYPCLNMISERLRFFHSLGVKGVFYNGSGTDYASLDDIQTTTIAAMLINPYIQADEYAIQCIHRYYPISGELISKAYTEWEERSGKYNSILPFYGGIADAVKAWLVPDKFEDFCSKLDKKSKEIKEDERTRLNKLLTALQFTRLELLRMPHGNYDAQTAAICLESLQGHTAFKKEMQNYREANGNLDKYIKEWETLIEENATSSNLILGIPLVAKYKPDANYTDLSILTDGRYALPSDYHTGWLIASPKEITIEIPPGKVKSGQHIKFSFMNAPHWRIRLPRSVEIWQAERRLHRMTFDPEQIKEPFTKYQLETQLNNVDILQPLEIRIYQSGEHRLTIACDEIKIY